MIENNTLTLEEYKELVSSVGWKLPSDRLINISLKNSLTVKYIIDNKTIAMARCVTDYGFAALIMDVIVHPDYQNNGYGSRILQTLIFQLKSTLEDNEEMLIELLAAPGRNKFYKKFGFKEKKEVVETGMYMWLKND